MTKRRWVESIRDLLTPQGKATPVKYLLEISKGQSCTKKSDRFRYTTLCLVSSEFLGNSRAHGQFLIGQFPCCFWPVFFLKLSLCFFFVRLSPWNEQFWMYMFKARCKLPLLQSLWNICYTIWLGKFWIFKTSCASSNLGGFVTTWPGGYDKNCHRVTSDPRSWKAVQFLPCLWEDCFSIHELPFKKPALWPLWQVMAVDHLGWTQPPIHSHWNVNEATSIL